MTNNTLEHHIYEGYDFDYIKTHMKTDATIQDVEDLLYKKASDLQDLIRFINRNELNESNEYKNLSELFNQIESLKDTLNNIDKERYYNHPLTIKHYKNLNNFSEIGLEQPWEITEDIYNNFLDILPPLKMDFRGFTMSEFYKDNITTEYYQNSNNEYFCKFVEVNNA